MCAHGNSHDSSNLSSSPVLLDAIFCLIVVRLLPTLGNIVAVLSVLVHDRRLATTGLCVAWSMMTTLWVLGVLNAFLLLFTFDKIDAGVWVVIGASAAADVVLHIMQMHIGRALRATKKQACSCSAAQQHELESRAQQTNVIGSPPPNYAAPAKTA